MKALSSAVSCFALIAALEACEVYDRELVSSSSAAAPVQPATHADSGIAMLLDAAVSRDAGMRRADSLSRPVAADGGELPARSPSGPAIDAAARPRTADPAEDSGPADPSSDQGVAVDGGSAGNATSAAPCGDQLCGFGWQRRILVDGSQVSQTLADFPVLLRISDPHLQQYAASSGDDLYFTGDDGLTLLDFEVERYSPNGELVAWVRVPNLTAGVDTTLFLGYGDGKVGRAKPSGVWSDYHHVWHLAEDPSAGDAAIRDSTDRAHGTAQGSMNAEALISGVAGAGLQFDGVDDEISFRNDLWGSGPSTFSGWVKQQAKLGDYGTSMLSLGDGSSDGSARFLLSRAEDNKVKCGFFGDDDLTTAVLPLNEWKYLSWTWDGRASAVYVDAVRVLGPVTHDQIATSGFVGKIGNSSFRFEYFMHGQLDELHIATTARSSAWTAAEYANQRPASTFIKVLGEPQPASPH